MAMSELETLHAALTEADVVMRPLDYVEKLDTRSPDQVRRVVIHATELPDLAEARVYGQRILYPDSGTGNSGHFYIDRDGSIEQWVPVDRNAHHVRGHNADTIGVELINRGRYPNWLATDSQHWPEPYTEAQIQALIGLLQVLDSGLSNLDHVIGHEHLDTETVPASNHAAIQVRRKTDPGPHFPWPEVVAASGLMFGTDGDAESPGQ